MNVIIPPKRRDKKTSFKKLVEYVSTRDEKKSSASVKANPQEHNEPTPSLSTPGFSQLVDYVGRKKTAPVTEVISVSPEGVQRVLSGDVLCETNCFSLDTAATEMNMTAAQNRHCKDAVYHFILSWQADEEPTADNIFKSVRHSLAALGMKDHQYVAAIHKDTDNVHCHVSANRVHPETFRAQNMWNDADTLQKCCRVLERELGFKVDNGSWEMDEYGDLHRTRRDMPAMPRGAAKREIFSDKESLHGYAVREVRDAITIASAENKLDWPWLHNMLHTKGLGLREQSGGLAVFDLLNPDEISIKASDVHPAISAGAMEQKFGMFQKAPPSFDPHQPENGMLSIDRAYMPQLHVRDQDVRRERREARAVARDILRARYDAYRSSWEKPDLRAAERFRQISSHSRVVKAHVRQTVRDPLMRKLMYRVAEFEKIKAMAELRIQLKEERQQLKDSGANRPLSWRNWVEREALQGDVAALSQMRGWAYREKRKAKDNGTKWPEPNAIIHFGPGDDVPIFKSPEHETRLLDDGTVSYLRAGKPAVTDFGDRVEVYASADSKSDRLNNDLAAELTAWRSGDRAVLSGEQTAINRVLYSGVVRNLTKNDEHDFKVTDAKQMADVRATEASLRNRHEQTVSREAEPQQTNDYGVSPVNKDLPRP
ncbi:relaxase/mobilization nuclease domain-containing protein [Cronobacter sakazakii]|uniref:TraI/MobA(P) family conjugative relaxase n=1 Tax=Cronobacter sakazakii TaxID=28141 RepID=UPI002937F207|nr:TraI/MobA(P) family conjugative relaxase [Cronobacter sakazakii]EKS1073428.1 relaxase/mobilization nuclease domain-containing protein [Cronobacter sakazakii]EKS1087106.1 relaxase/mobilization nuclease domain-containing protein [Cronobacter sakazakii]ELQ5973782.1 relaxase/mobilization nuclease domain-containing protein [Cronobacter sakazakii]ELQ6034802.1 relaxase/mobilization nuclease domain-containing protein [Cronobacter sakazakii]ELQ6043517.1 relaxase/mobilization nuclease domain-containi